MSDKPILFNTDMVQALLDGRKTQTRRVVKDKNNLFDALDFLAGTPDDGPGIIENLGQQWIDGKFWVWCREYPEEGGEEIICPHGQPGDLLWVRETYRCNGWATDLATIFYRAHENASYTEMCEQYPIANYKPLPVDGKWKPSIHMPRWASRLTLHIKDIRVERVQDITNDDAIKEGALRLSDPSSQSDWSKGFAIACFHKLWDSINIKRGYGWNVNPWVWVIEFEVIKKNIDEVKEI